MLRVLMGLLYLYILWFYVGGGTVNKQKKLKSRVWSSASGRTERTCPNQLNKLIWLLVESPSSTRRKIEHVGINVALQHRMPDPVLRLGPRTSIQPLGLNGQGPGTQAQAPLTNHHYPHETSIKVMSRIIGRQCKVLPGLT